MSQRVNIRGGANGNVLSETIAVVNQVLGEIPISSTFHLSIVSNDNVQIKRKLVKCIVRWHLCLPLAIKPSSRFYQMWDCYRKPSTTWRNTGWQRSSPRYLFSSVDKCPFKRSFIYTSQNFASSVSCNSFSIVRPKTLLILIRRKQAELSATCSRKRTLYALCDDSRYPRSKHTHRRHAYLSFLHQKIFSLLYSKA